MLDVAVCDTFTGAAVVAARPSFRPVRGLASFGVRHGAEDRRSMSHHDEALARLRELHIPLGLRALRRRRTPTEHDLVAVGGMTREEARDSLVEWRRAVHKILVRAARRDRRERAGPLHGGAAAPAGERPPSP